jgi:hypothetical protein
LGCWSGRWQLSVPRMANGAGRDVRREAPRGSLRSLRSRRLRKRRRRRPARLRRPRVTTGQRRRLELPRSRVLTATEAAARTREPRERGRGLVRGRQAAGTQGRERGPLRAPPRRPLQRGRSGRTRVHAPLRVVEPEIIPVTGNAPDPGAEQVRAPAPRFRPALYRGRAHPPQPGTPIAPPALIPAQVHAPIRARELQLRELAWERIQERGIEQRGQEPIRARVIRSTPARGWVHTRVARRIERREPEPFPARVIRSTPAQ